MQASDKNGHTVKHSNNGLNIKKGLTLSQLISESQINISNQYNIHFQIIITMKTYKKHKKQNKTSKVVSGEITHNYSFPTHSPYIRHSKIKRAI